MRLATAFSLSILGGILAGCSADSGGPVDDEAALGRSSSPSSSSSTAVVTDRDDRDRVGEFSFEIVTKAAKRVAIVHARRGDAKADLECSQLTNIHATATDDEVVTLCEEQIRPGYEYVSVYFRYQPTSSRWSFDVIASHPTKLTQHQRDLYELFTGMKVKSPPPPANVPDASHREEADKLPLKWATHGTDPFADPIALAKEVHEGFRGPLGMKMLDHTRQDTPFTVDRLTSYTDFTTLVYAVQVHGQDTNQLWHFAGNAKVAVSSTPNSLATAAKVSSELKHALEAL